MTQAQLSSTPQPQVPNLLQLAKAGDPKAIASLLNRNLQPKGIAVRAIVRDHVLRISLEAENLPQETRLAPHLETALRNLSPETIESISISGFQTGFSRPTWIHSFDLTESAIQTSAQVTAADPEPTPVQPQVIPPDPSDPLLPWLSDLDEETLTLLAQQLQSPDLSNAEVVLDRLRHWHQQAQDLSVTDMEQLSATDLSQMALALRILQLQQMQGEDLMLLLAGL